MQPASLLSRLVGLYSNVFCIYWAASVQCDWLIHCKSGRYWIVFRKRKAHRQCGADTHCMFVCMCVSAPESFVGSICILGSWSRLCILQQAGFLAQLLCAKFITCCTQLTSVNFLCTTLHDAMCSQSIDGYSRRYAPKCNSSVSVTRDMSWHTHQYSEQV